MFLNSIFLRNFRCLSELSCDFSQKQFFTGRNGVGKTSVLEAACVVCTGKSFRTSRKKSIIRNGENHLYVSGTVVDNERYETDLSVGFDKSGARRITIDDEVASRRDLMGTVSCVVHVPDDIDIIRGTPSVRRDFTDRIVFMEFPEYYDIYMNYRRFMKHKTVVLRSGGAEQLKHINIAGAGFIRKIRSMRRTVLDRLGSILDTLLSETSFTAEVTVRAPDDEPVEERLEAAVEREIERGYPLYGPHLDRIRISVAERTRDSVSFGELSFLSFLLRIAELQLYGEGNRYPVFLCDDIFSFLDDEKQRFILKFLEKMKNQTICTAVSSISDNTVGFAVKSLS